MSSQPLGDIRHKVPYGQTHVTKLWSYGATLAHGANFRRKDVAFNPDNATVSDGGLVRFIIPRNGYVDLTKMQLQLSVGPITGVPGTGTLYGAFFDLGSWCIIDRIRVLHGSTQIQQIDYYNYLQNVMHSITGDVFANGTYEGNKYNALAYNLSPPAMREDFAKTTQNWLIPLNIESLVSKVLPMKHMSDSIIIELYINKAIRCCSTAAAPPNTNPLVYATPTFQLSNIKLRGEMVTVTREYDEQIKSALARNGLSWRFSSWSITSRNVQNSTETVQITDKLGSVDNVIALHTPSLFRTTPNMYTIRSTVVAGIEVRSSTDSGDMTWSWPTLGVSKYAFKLAGEYYPPDMVQVDAGIDTSTMKYWSINSSGYNVDSTPIYHSDYWINAGKALGKISSYSNVRTGDIWQPVGYNLARGYPAGVDPLYNSIYSSNPYRGGTTFLMPQNFETFTNADLVDGIDTTRLENVFQLVIQYKQTLPQAIPLLLMVQYESVATFTKDGFALSK